MQFGRFELVERVATGGMGEVFRARTVGGSRWFALKRLPKEASSDPMLAGMFIDEARMANAVTGRNVARLVEHGEVDGQHYLVFDWIAGVTLEELLAKLKQKGRELPIDQMARLFAGLADALEQLHQTRDAQGRPIRMVHRDVSPGNLMIDLDGAPHIVDFGLSKSRLQLQTTQPGFVKGKFGYLAPEQLTGGADARTDVFALGLCAYEALTGERLFERPTIEATVSALKGYVGVRSLRPLRPELPEALDEVVCKMLAPRPDDRYASAAEVKRALVGAMPALLLSGEDLEEATGALVSRLFPTRVGLERKPASSSRNSSPTPEPARTSRSGASSAVMVLSTLAVIAAVVGAVFALR